MPPASPSSTWLEQERHAAANTVEAYGHALAGFLGFLTNHLGGEPDLAALAGLRAADIRAWLAALANATAGGIVARAAPIGGSRLFPFPRPAGTAWRYTAVRLVATARARPPCPAR